MLQTVLFVGPGGIVCVVLVEMRELLCSACCEELATAAAAAAMYGVRVVNAGLDSSNEHDRTIGRAFTQRAVQS
jgi:hypothetical protein